MNIVTTPIEGLVLIEAKIFTDTRGSFLEAYSRAAFAEAGLPLEWAQDNLSRSTKNVLRGLHFQRAPMAQAKLVRVIRGSVFDVAVDLRPDSKTFGKWYGVELDGESQKSFYIPEGFAHGFCVLSEEADFHYKCTRGYSPKDDGGIVWDDPDIGIAWPVKNPILSAKDAALPTLKDFRKTAC